MNRIVRFKAFAYFSFILGLLALSCSLAYGQAISGNVVGVVVDSSGAAVVGADVTARSISTGVTWSNKSNSTGGYRFDNLPIGSYEISAKASGFQTTSEKVEVQLNKSGTANLTLTPGSASTTIEVAGVAETLDTTTAQIQTTYEEKQLDDLPTTALGVNGPTGQNLGVLNLALLDAGTGSSGGLGAGTGPSVSGERPRDNNFTTEGVDNNRGSSIIALQDSIFPRPDSPDFGTPVANCSQQYPRK